MILRLIKAIFNSLIWIVIKIATALFRIINVARLWVIVAYLAICGILQLSFSLFSNEPFDLLFFLGLLICALITIYLIVKKLFKREVQPKEKKKQKTNLYDGFLVSKSEIEERKRLKEEQKLIDKPTYFKVDGNEDFLMAEYPDRYELYILIDGRYKFVRTDYKVENDYDIDIS